MLLLDKRRQEARLILELRPDGYSVERLKKCNRIVGFDLSTSDSSSLWLDMAHTVTVETKSGPQGSHFLFLQFSGDKGGVLLVCSEHGDGDYLQVRKMLIDARQGVDY